MIEYITLYLFSLFFFSLRPVVIKYLRVPLLVFLYIVAFIYIITSCCIIAYYNEEKNIHTHLFKILNEGKYTILTFGLGIILMDCYYKPLPIYLSTIFVQFFPFVILLIMHLFHNWFDANSSVLVEAKKEYCQNKSFL